MQENTMDKALIKFDTVEKAARALGITTRTLFAYKSRRKE